MAASRKIPLKLGRTKGAFDSTGTGTAKFKVSKKGRLALKELSRLKASLKVKISSEPRVRRFPVTLKRKR